MALEPWPPPVASMAPSAAFVAAWPPPVRVAAGGSGRAMAAPTRRHVELLAAPHLGGPGRPAALALVAAGLHLAAARRRFARPGRTARAGKRRTRLYEIPGLRREKFGTKVDLPDAGPKEEWKSMGAINDSQMQQMRVTQLNNLFKQQWKKSGRKSIPYKFGFTERPDNPWRDRYLLCGDCERREDQGKKPRTTCSCSTLLEVDMTVPFSRDNVLATSCKIVQLVLDDKWVVKDADGHIRECEGKEVPDSFPVQVCAVCRKTSLEEGRKFRQCPTCFGVSYCCDEHYAQHRLTHRAHCTPPSLPHRKEWGIRKPLRAMRDEIYPMIHKWAIREPIKHRIAWLPPPEHHTRRLQDPNAKSKKLMLPGFSHKRRKSLAPPSRWARVAEGGEIEIVEQPRKFWLHKPKALPPAVAEPDPECLITLGMTLEEYQAKEARLTAIAEEKEAALVLAGDSEAVRYNMLDHGPADEEPEEALEAEVVSQEPLSLSPEALDRLKAASRKPLAKPPKKRTKAPWVILEEEEVEAGRRGVKTLEPPNKPPPEEQKDGVIYRENFVREENKHEGIKLSEESLKRLEEVAAMARKHNPKSGLV